MLMNGARLSRQSFEGSNGVNLWFERLKLLPSCRTVYVFTETEAEKEREEVE